MISNRINDDEERPDYYYVEDIKLQQKYYPHDDDNKYTYNLFKQGQLKLLINEIRFLSEDVEIHNFKKDSFIILYVGSGKGFHIPYLINLYFKYDIEWYLYDPNGHCDKLMKLRNKYPKKIKINDVYFTEENINEFKNINKKLIFISDFRTCDYHSKEPNTKNLLNDYKIQNNILTTLQPLFSLVKFKFPFPDDWEDNVMSFLKPVGKNYIQAFTKIGSNEFRICLNSIIIFKEVSSRNTLTIYEEKFRWYNKSCRVINKCDLKIAMHVFNLYYKNEYNKDKKFDETNILSHIKTITNSF